MRPVVSLQLESGAAPVLLQSVVEVARAIFGAAASSVFLLDEPAGELVFQACSGAGEDWLVGTRMPAHRGIAGWVLGSGQAMIADDLASNTSFDRAFAESTQYVPQALMAAPLIVDQEVLGVLEVLDPAPQSRSDLGDLDLLSLFANQAAIALRVTRAHVPLRETDLVDAFRSFLQTRKPVGQS
jgi:GAF domain-containing protein